MEVVVNGRARAVGERATVADLVRDLGLEGKPIAVELNLEVVPKNRFGSSPLRAGDRVEIVSFVGGG